MAARYDRFDWLDLRHEAAVDPEAPIIDAHHHFFDRPGRRYLAEELHADVSRSHNITHTVFVDCGFRIADRRSSDPVDETRAVVDEARRFAELGSARLGAIVSHADMMLGARIGSVLDAHVDAGAGLFRGIRHGTNLSDDPAAPNGSHGPTAGMMASDEFVAAAHELVARNLTFDAWVYHEQLDEVAALAAAVPGLTIVLNHLGGPLGVGRFADNRVETMTTWARGMADLAERSNVVVKVGGLGMDQRFGTGWSRAERPPASVEVAAYWRPWVEQIIESFGPDRVLCESNFPVDRESLPYPIVWNALRHLIADHSAAERSAMLHRTAARVYRIDL